MNEWISDGMGSVCYITHTTGPNVCAYPLPDQGPWLNEHVVVEHLPGFQPCKARVEKQSCTTHSRCWREIAWEQYRCVHTYLLAPRCHEYEYHRRDSLVGLEMDGLWDAHIVCWGRDPPAHRLKRSVGLGDVFLCHVAESIGPLIKGVTSSYTVTACVCMYDGQCL